MANAKENERMRKERLEGSNNGATLRTRVVSSKKYKRNKKKIEEDEN